MMKLIVLLIFIIILGAFIRFKIIEIQENKLCQLKREQINNLTGIEFEEYLKARFKKEGYKVETTPKTCDFGADLVLKNSKETIVVQAKRYKNKVGIAAIQQAIGAIAYYKADRAIVVTNSQYTKSAWELARANNVKLIDSSKLVVLNINEESSKCDCICPKCGNKLVLRKGKYGNFYGCSNYPKCKYTRNALS